MGQDVTPGYNNKIPETILTQDKVETRIGTLEFFDGIPTEQIASLVYDSLDFHRGVETFLNGLPANSLEAMRRRMASIGARNSNQIVIFDKLMDSDPLFLTGNTDTVYAVACLSLKKDDPTVLEILTCPPKTGPHVKLEQWIEGGRKMSNRRRFTANRSSGSYAM
jgi:hypothetical protein